MNNKLVFFLVKKYLKFDKSQPFITISSIFAFVGVSLGVMVLIIAMSLMNGMSKEFEKKLSAMNYPITIYPTISNNIKHSVLENLEYKFPDFKFSPFVKTQAVIKNGGKISGVVIYGVDFNRENKINYILKEKLQDKQIEEFEIVLGDGISKSLALYSGDKAVAIFTNTDPMGLSLIPTMKKFTIADTFKSGLVAYDKVFTYTTISSLQKILRKSSNEYNGIHISSDNPMQDIKSLREELPEDIGVVGWWQQNGNLFYAMQMEKTALFIVLMLIILVASLNIISSMLMTVMNRRKDIALLLSLGLSKKEIQKTFFYLGGIIGGSGIVVGTSLGLLSIYILGNFDIIDIPEDVYGTAHLPINLSMFDFVSIIVGATIIILVSSIYPSRKASNVDAISVLRHE
jgi:putative ABC transport system permease protein